MTGDTAIWIDAATWKDNWEKVEELKGGGQGDAFRVKRNSDSHPGFLKIIKSKNDKERRARFFREANAYDTFRFAGVPHLIESNAHRHGDLAFTPYLVTEFVEGPTLANWRDGQAVVSLETAVTLTRELVQILKNCHREGCVHRDVKPDNIILLNGDPARPVLLDFGLNYHDMPDINFQTEDAQEVGNRFLRLPELSAGSLLKQDQRSDVSFAAGILFYVLTKDHPDLLRDAEGHLPHQRSSSFAKIQSLAGQRIARLSALFDTGFAPTLTHRYTNASALLSSLENLMTEQTPGRSADEDLKSLNEILNTSMEKYRSETVATIRLGINEVKSVFDGVGAELNGQLSMGQTSNVVEGDRGKNTLFWTRHGSSDRLHSTTYEVFTSGEELVFRFSGETLYRTSLDNPKYGDAFRNVIRSWLLQGLLTVLNDPEALPPEADHFQEVKPQKALGDAAVLASTSNRNILAFVYDPTQPERGRLDYGLGYFLENRRTRDTMNASFVTALVPLSGFASVSNALDNLSMERCRIVVLDHSFKFLEQMVIAANPSEGERIVMELAAKYS